MGRLLKQHNDGTFQIWSTVTDSYVSERGDRKVILNSLYEDRVLAMKLKVIEDFMTFPAGWFDKDSHKRVAHDSAAYLEWHLEALKSKNYANVVDAKYAQAIRYLEGRG